LFFFLKQKHISRLQQATADPCWLRFNATNWRFGSDKSSIYQ